MKKKHEELPIKEEGNGERLRTMTYDFADAAMMYSAMMIGANTVLMCGSGKAYQRMLYYKNRFLEACPPGYQHFCREEDLANIAIMMMDAEKCTITKTKTYSSSKECGYEVRINEKKWTGTWLNDEKFSELVECVRLVAPMSCEIVTEERVEKW